MLGGQPLVWHTLHALSSVPDIHRILVVVSPGDDFIKNAPERVDTQAVGGASRAESVSNGLAALLATGASADEWVLVHDAARCLVLPGDIQRLIDACRGDAVGGLLAVPLADTLKQASDGRSAQTLARAGKWLAQTPQMFRIGALQAALAPHAANGYEGITDEASAMELAGHCPLLVEGGSHNLKVTYPQDFLVAKALLEGRA
ncbi:2-C-methyl-D-erythritol 4-phosphate cytidylyltransferase [Hydrogenophaga sp. 5NK40-0174]